MGDQARDHTGLHASTGAREGCPKPVGLAPVEGDREMDRRSERTIFGVRDCWPPSAGMVS